MKRRTRLLINLCSIALLGFALYLNFVKRDAPDLPLPGNPNNLPVSEGLEKKEQKQLTAKEDEKKTDFK